MSAAIALMLQIRPGLDASGARSLLLASRDAAGTSINVCRAMAALRGSADSSCQSTAPAAVDTIPRR